MILMVPISPEVPKIHRPKLWPSLVMVITMGILFLQIHPIIEKDTEYVENIQDIMDKKGTTSPDVFLKDRPLLKIAPAKADWDIKRLILANFIHGTPLHLLLNLVGVFAGVRIVSTFLPFLCTIAIFLLGGSVGLGFSLAVTEQFSPYIPHVGASAGIFALMGTYYVYNFRYRTTYFFWFPTRKGFISLRTSWFFFMDVLLLELVLSTAQLFPERIDSVDHIAHVAGFVAGAGLAFVLRTLQNWPSFLQTRGEFIYWNELLRPKILHSAAGQTSSKVVRAYAGWIELLQMNRYNDQLKIRICNILKKKQEEFSASDVDSGFRFLNPTFVRLHTKDVADCLRALLNANRPLPKRWLARLPYDSLIRLAKELTFPIEDQKLLYRLFTEYKKAQPMRADIEEKIEALLGKLQGIIPEAVPDSGEKSGNGTAEDTQPQVEEDSKEKTAKVAF